MSLNLNPEAIEQVEASTKQALGPVKDFYGVLRRLLKQKYGALTIFIALSAIEHVCQRVRDTLWSRMGEELPLDEGTQSALHAYLDDRAQSLAACPEVRLADAQELKKGELWTPEDKKFKLK